MLGPLVVKSSGPGRVHVELVVERAFQHLLPPFLSLSLGLAFPEGSFFAQQAALSRKLNL
jgi:hypothetical protein